jgi:hypothetical protein
MWLLHCMRRAASRADWTAGGRSDQDADDRNDHQQLNQSKTSSPNSHYFESSIKTTTVKKE